MIRVTVEVLPAGAGARKKYTMTIENATGAGETADYIVHLDPPSTSDGRNAAIVRRYPRKRGLFSLVSEALCSLGLTDTF